MRQSRYVAYEMINSVGKSLFHLIPIRFNVSVVMKLVEDHISCMVQELKKIPAFSQNDSRHSAAKHCTSHFETPGMITTVYFTISQICHGI